MVLSASGSMSRANKPSGSLGDKAKMLLDILIRFMEIACLCRQARDDSSLGKNV